MGMHECIYLKAHAPRPPPCLMHIATAVSRLLSSAAGQATVDMSTSGWLMCGGERHDLGERRHTFVHSEPPTAKDIHLLMVHG